MLTKVDKRDFHIVLKWTLPNGKLLGYLAGVPGDFGTMQQFPSLQDARNFIGKEDSNGKAT